MNDKDSIILFETYRKIYEAPVDPGESWDEPDAAKKFDKDETSRLAKYKVNDPETVNKIVHAVKEFLNDHENSHYPGAYKDFRKDIQATVAAAAGINMTNAGYVSRVIQNALKRLSIISIDGPSKEVTVGDADKNGEKLKDAISDGLGTPVDDSDSLLPDRPTKWDEAVEYTVDPLVAHDLPRVEKELIEYVQDGMDGREIRYTLENSLFFRNSEEAGGLGGNTMRLNNILRTWVKNGVLIPAEKPDETKEIEDLGATDSPYAAGDYLANQGIDVPTADPWHGGYGEY